MTTGYNVLLRNAQLDAITSFVGAAGKLAVYSGTRPATGGSVGAAVKLAEFTTGSPFAPAAASGVLHPNLPAPTVGLAAGTATWFRLIKADATFAIDGSVGTSAADLILNTTTISVDVDVTAEDWTITRGNP